jgi:hypothetical protein
MTTRRLALLLTLLLAVPLSAAAQGKAKKYSIKTADTAPPKALSEDMRKLLPDKCIQVQDAKGTTILEVWLRKELPVKATEAQIKNGLTYKEVPISTVVGAVRVVKTFTDYRKQTVKAGTYTLRIARQPEDGDHQGTAPHNEFLLLAPAKDDTKPDLMEVKDLQELSGKTIEGHPSVMLLFPGTGAAKAPKLVTKEGGHWVILIELPALAGKNKATLPIGLTVVGVSASA